MATRATVKISRAKLEAVVGAHVVRYHRDLMRQIENTAKVDTPVDTGLLRSSYRQRTEVRRRRVRSVLENRVHYAAWVHDGTGLYGPRHRRITPTTAKALRFTYKGAVVMVASTAGMKGRPFLRRAVVKVARRKRGLRVVVP